jgi:tetratricopeptide (TPR) repeat protein
MQGKPVDGATVTIELGDSGRKFVTKTDSKGQFFQIGLGKGTYKITAEKGGVSGQGMVAHPGGTNSLRLPGAIVIGAPAGGASGAAAEMQKVFEEGVAADRAGNHDDAIAKFTRAAELNPKCADCFYNIGLAQAAKKDYPAAEGSFKKAIEVKPEHADSYNGLANIYNAQRKFDQAAEASAKAASLAGSAGGALGGGNPDALFNQGVILWNAGKVADAKKQFEAAIAANPNHAEAHYQLGMALVNEGNLKGAGAEFETYLKLAPNGPNAAQAKALAAQLPK